MNKKILGVYDLFLIAGVIVCNFIYAFFAKEWDIMGIIAAISGVLCVVLAAKGSIVNYFFGIIQVSLYSYIAYKSAAYGNAAVNAFYYLPMQFVGWWQWSKRGACASVDEDSSVKARRLSKQWRLGVSLLSMLAIIGLGWLLKYLGGSQPWTDSITTVLCVSAQALMALAFMEQWILWIIFNIFTVAMWIIFAVKGTEHAVPMLIMYIFYLMNSINGLCVWWRLSKKI